MPQGLQIFDENGKEVFSPKTRTVKILKKAPLTLDSGGVSVTHSLVPKLTPFYIVTPHVRGALSHHIGFSVTGSTAKVWVSPESDANPEYVKTLTVYIGVL